MIKQLQKNQLALTEGLDKNRLGITQGFDKMGEIKKWDLQQLPSYEAIEEPEEIEEKEPEEVPEDENTKYRISFEDLNKIIGHDKYTQEGMTSIERNLLDEFIERYGFLNQNKYEIEIVDPNTRLLKVVEKPITFKYDKDEIDKYLMNEKSIDLLHFLKFYLPSEYKDKSLKELQEALKESQKESSKLKDKLKNVTKYNHFEGKSFAKPKNKNPIKNTIQNIEEHNIVEIYNYNLNLLREFKEKTGTGILHFNNPLQLLDRLELLGGSILAGNNGVKQEFSQIAHLLNQMKVITKKQLNDLLKKYILNK